MRKILAIFLVAVASYSYCGVAHGFVHENSNHFSTFQERDYLPHIVQRGESISSVLKTYKMSLKYFIEYNPEIKYRRGLVVAEVLKIPRAAIASATDGVIDREIKEFNLTIEPTEVAIAEAVDALVGTGIYEPESLDMSNTKVVYHNVLAGETLYQISKKYDAKIDDILTLNPIVIEKGLMQNTFILIPVPVKRIGDYIYTDVRRSDKTSTDVATAAAGEAEAVATAAEAAAVAAAAAVEVATLAIAETDILYDDVNKYESTYINDVKNVDTRASNLYGSYMATDEVSVAVIMPIAGDDDLREDGFKDLYRGFLLAADSLKKVGLSTKVDFYGIGRGTDVVYGLIASGELQDKDLIIGPVFETQFGLVARYAGSRGIPIINPLLPTVENNGSIIEIIPAEHTKWEKLKGIADNKKVFHYQSVNDDYEFVDGFMEHIGHIDRMLVYDKHLSVDTMALELDSLVDNLFIVAAKDVLNNELLISKLVAVKQAAAGRSLTILATSNVAKIDEDRRSDFFKADLLYVAQSFQDRSDVASKRFETSYIDTYFLPPTPFSYRGYEVGIMLLEALYDYGENITDDLNDEDITVLQVPYKFHRSDKSSKLINQEWLLINYKPNYSIVVE